MSALAALASGRQAIESLMIDECVIERATGEVTDDAGNVTITYTAVYAGKCRFQYRGLAAGSPYSGQQRVDLFSLEVQLPIAVTAVQVNDRVTAGISLDPAMQGRIFRVANIAHKTHYTARRLPLEEVTS